MLILDYPFNLSIMKQLIALFLSLITLSGLSQTSFKGTTTEIKGNIHEVETGNITFNQSLDLLAYSVLKYQSIEIDKKGKQKELIYEFNVADLDPYLVKVETKQDVIYLSLSVDNGQKFIKKYENAEVKGYIEKISIAAKDIDNARVLRELFKEAIPQARKIMDNKLQVKTLGEMEAWLAKNIADVESGSKSYGQKMTPLNDFTTNFQLTQTSATSKSTQVKKYIFNLADINIKSLKFNISGASFSLDLETNRKQKVIKIVEDGSSYSFASKIKIYANNVEEARDLKNILIKAIPIAKEKVKSSIPSFKDVNTSANYLTKFVQPVTYSDETFDQSIEGTTMIKLSRIESGTKSSKRVEAEFNIIDINETSIDYNVVNNRMFVSFSTNESQNLIKVNRDNEFHSYSNKHRIYAENIEVARRIKSALESSVQISKQNYTDPFQSMPLKSKVSWLEQNTTEGQFENKTITQTFEQSNSSDPNKMKLTVIEVDSKNSTEEIYEFNFTDLNPESIQFDISSKNIKIPFETKFKEDIIKHYKNGEIENYQSGFELRMTDIEKARKVISAFKHIIEELGE